MPLLKKAFLETKTSFIGFRADLNIFHVTLATSSLGRLCLDQTTLIVDLVIKQSNV